MAIAVQVVAWLTEQAAPQWLPECWPEMPWGWLILCTLAFLAGLLFNDWYNPHSIMRERWQYATRFFDFLTTGTPPHKSNDDYFHLIVTFRFARNIQPTNILMKVFSPQKGNEFQLKFTKKLAEGRQFLKDQEESFVLAMLSNKSNRNSWWGLDDDQPQCFMTWGGRYIVEIIVICGRKEQSCRIYFERYGSMLAMEERPFFLLKEDPQMPEGIKFFKMQ
ncbi:MAG: hypothetical protein AB7P32_17495 [Nitrospirales bacterium]